MHEYALPEHAPAPLQWSADVQALLSSHDVVFVAYAVGTQPPRPSHAAAVTQGDSKPLQEYKEPAHTLPARQTSFLVHGLESSQTAPRLDGPQTVHKPRVQLPLMQSAPTKQVLPAAHAGQCGPPQSMSLSPSSRMRSLHVAVRQTPEKPEQNEESPLLSTHAVLLLAKEISRQPPLPSH